MERSKLSVEIKDNREITNMWGLQYSCDIYLFISFSDKPLIKCEGTDSYWNTILYSPEQRVCWQGHSAVSLDSPGLCLLSEADHLWMTLQAGVVSKRLSGGPVTRGICSNVRWVVILLMMSYDEEVGGGGGEGGVIHLSWPRRARSDIPLSPSDRHQQGHTCPKTPSVSSGQI